MALKEPRTNVLVPEPKEGVNLGQGTIKSSLEGLAQLNEGHQDFLQAGVVASTDWSLTANINSGTGALGSTGNTGGTAWLPDPVVSGALMRSVTTSATLSGIAPSLLPASGKYVSCAFELTPSTWGAGATVTAHSGVEKSTEAEAVAAPPATTAGKMQVRRVIIRNTTGVYSIVAQEDIRSWVATGPWISLPLGEKWEGGGGGPYAPQIRSECAGRIARISGFAKVKAGQKVTGGSLFTGIPFSCQQKEEPIEQWIGTSGICFIPKEGESPRMALVEVHREGGVYRGPEIVGGEELHISFAYPLY